MVPPAPSLPSINLSPTPFRTPLRFSPVQVATHTDHSFPSSLQTYITFEGRARPAPLAVWPFGAPVLLLRCCHGRYCFAPRVPLNPPKHTYRRRNKRETASGPRSFGRLQGFLSTIGLSACQSYRIERKDWSKGRGRKEVYVVPPLHNDYWLKQSRSVCNAMGLVNIPYVLSPRPGRALFV